eukprot:8017213-Alexandrium_andersonii.AAC.1
MSASLVGSEMCIRDSRAAARPARTRFRRALVAADRLVETQGGDADFLDCLLYTSDAADDM